MGRKKVNKSQRVRELLAEGLTVQQISHKLQMPKNYIYTQMWKDKQKKKVNPVNPSVAVAKDVPEVTLDVTEVFQLMGLRQAIKILNHEIACIETRMSKEVIM